MEKDFKVSVRNLLLSPKYRFPVFLSILAVFFLLWNLSGDPTILKRYGDYSDEGYWLQNPSNKILHGSFITDDQTQGFFGAPLYNQIITLQFKLFGISFLSSRVISILLLILTACIVQRILKLQIKEPLIFTASFLLLFDNKIFYQWSTPVSLEIFWQALLILFLIKNRLQKITVKASAIALLYLAVLSKTTSIWLLGFVLLIYIVDHRETLMKPREIFNFIVFSVACLLPFLLLNLFFSHIEHDRFMKFSQLLKLNTNLSWTFLDNILNPVYYLKQLTAIFKFPNSFLLILLPFLFPLFLSKNNTGKNVWEIVDSRRANVILVLFILSQVFFLMIIGQFGYDRRQINLIVPVFILSIFLLDSLSLKTLKASDLIYISAVFIIIILLQVKQLYHEIYRQSNSMGLRENVSILSTSEMIISWIIIIAVLAGSVYMIFKYRMNYLFYLFIAMNIFFHIAFLNNGHSLKDASLKIGKISKAYNVKYITGIQAHHLSLGTTVIPIWYLEKWAGPPYWNEGFNLFTPDNPTMILTNLNLNESIGYYPIKNVPKDYNLVLSDTVYLYKNKLLGSYLDTLIIHVVSHSGQ